MDSGIRFIRAPEPRTPPADRIELWYDQEELIFKIKREDGIAEPLVAGSQSSTINAERLRVICKNLTAQTIPAFRAVYVTGSHNHKMTVELAEGGQNFDKSKIIGVTASQIEAGENGYVVISGTVESINTDSFEEGDKLWLSSDLPGELVSAKPQKPNSAVFVGVVTKKNQTNGIFQVNFQNSFFIDELNNVKIENPQDGEAISYNESEGLWKNKAIILNNLDGDEQDAAPSILAIKSYIEQKIEELTFGQQIIEYFTLDLSQVQNRAITLSHIPEIAENVSLDVISNGPQIYLEDFIVVGSSLSWSGRGLHDILAVGDKLRVMYSL